MTVVPSVRQNRRYYRGCCGGCPGSTAEGACITKMHLVSRAGLYAVLPYGHPRLRTRKAPRLSLSPDSSAELKAAISRPSEGAAAPSEQSGTGSPVFLLPPRGGSARNRGHRRAASHEKKAPTATGYGVSRGIVTAVRAVIGRRGLPGQMVGRIGAFRHRCPSAKRRFHNGIRPSGIGKTR